VAADGAAWALPGQRQSRCGVTGVRASVRWQTVAGRRPPGGGAEGCPVATAADATTASSAQRPEAAPCGGRCG